APSFQEGSGSVCAAANAAASRAMRPASGTALTSVRLMSDEFVDARFVATRTPNISRIGDVALELLSSERLSRHGSAEPGRCLPRCGRGIARSPCSPFPALARFGKSELGGGLSNGASRFGRTLEPLLGRLPCRVPPPATSPRRPSQPRSIQEKPPPNLPRS